MNEYLLKDFMKNLNFEDVKKHIGEDFCIDFDNDDNIWCEFDKTGNYRCFDHFEITEDMDDDDFEWEVKKIEEDIDELKEIQQDLTVTTEDYRQRTLDWVNDELKYWDFKAIPIQKYNDENEVIETIKKVNADDPDLEDFLEEFNMDDELEISLVKEKDGTYSTWEDYTDNGEVIDVIHVPMKQVLNTDNIIYKPSLSDCQKIKDKFSYKNKRHDYDWER